MLNNEVSRKVSNDKLSQIDYHVTLPEIYLILPCDFEIHVYLQLIFVVASTQILFDILWKTIYNSNISATAHVEKRGRIQHSRV
jgi:hypothetical protein